MGKWWLFMGFEEIYSDTITVMRVNGGYHGNIARTLLLPSGFIKHSIGKSLISGGVHRKITYKWSIFHCHV